MIQSKKEVIDALRSNTLAFIETVAGQSAEVFEKSEGGKWSSGQQLVHLIKSIKPLNFALWLPGFVPVLLFGKPKRNPMTYEQIKAFYQGKLTEGAKATGNYDVQKPVAVGSREKLNATYKQELDKLCAAIENLPESSLDKMQLPHPILGKLSLREMLFFTIYHTEHHTRSVAEVK